MSHFKVWDTVSQSRLGEMRGGFIHFIATRIHYVGTCCLRRIN